MICFIKSIRLPVMLFLAAILLAGCGNPAVSAQSPVTTNPSVAPSTTATAQPQATASPALGDTIALPGGWTMEQAVSVSEIEALVNDTGYTIFPEASSNAANGSPAGGFVKKNANGNLKLTFLAFVNGKEEKYTFFKDYVVEGTLQEINSELWDKAFVGDFADKSAAIVVLKGDVCVRINWFPEAYPQFEKADFGTKLATLLINNLYGGERLADSVQGTGADETDSEDASLAEADPDIPDELPPELKDVPSLNEYATTLWMDYVKPDIFESDWFSDAEKANARKALKLIIAAEDKAIALYDKNEHLYYLRGAAYAQCYYDTKDAVYKEKALADLKKAADMGLTLAQTEYDTVKGK
ncbi:MAG: hypothetical protein AAGU74_06435 [Bacillota bacterium]